MLIFRVPHQAAIKPVYLALAAIALMVVLGLALALWPRGAGLSDYRPGHGAPQR